MNTTIDFDEAKRLYELGMTHKEVGKILGFADTSIGYLFKKNGYKSRPRKPRSCKGSSNNNWKEKGVKYSALHHRVWSAKGKPKRCDVCGIDKPNIIYEWANLTGKYDDVNDYKRMCHSCHCKYDERHLHFKHQKKAGLGELFARAWEAV